MAGKNRFERRERFSAGAVACRGPARPPWDATYYDATYRARNVGVRHVLTGWGLDFRHALLSARPDTDQHRETDREDATGESARHRHAHHFHDVHVSGSQPVEKALSGAGDAGRLAVERPFDGETTE